MSEYNSGIEALHAKKTLETIESYASEWGVPLAAVYSVFKKLLDQMSRNGFVFCQVLDQEHMDYLFSQWKAGKRTIFSFESLIRQWKESQKSEDPQGTGGQVSQGGQGDNSQAGGGGATGGRNGLGVSNPVNDSNPS